MISGPMPSPRATVMGVAFAISVFALRCRGRSGRPASPKPYHRVANGFKLGAREKGPLGLSGGGNCAGRGVGLRGARPPRERHRPARAPARDRRGAEPRPVVFAPRPADDARSRGGRGDRERPGGRAHRGAGPGRGRARHRAADLAGPGAGRDAPRRRSRSCGRSSPRVASDERRIAPARQGGRLAGREPRDAPAPARGDRRRHPRARGGEGAARRRGAGAEGPPREDPRTSRRRAS